MDREALGRRVREVWIAWAKEQPNPKPSWLVPWEGLSELDREVDRRIGETIACETVASTVPALIAAAADLDIDALERLLEAAAASPRPWRASTDQPDDVMIWGPPSETETETDARWVANVGWSIDGERSAEANAALIVGAVNALAPLLAEVRRLRTAVAEAVS